MKYAEHEAFCLMSLWMVTTLLVMQARLCRQEEVVMSRFRSFRNEQCVSQGATSRESRFDAKSVPNSRNSTFLSCIVPIYDIVGSGRDCHSWKKYVCNLTACILHRIIEDHECGPLLDEQDCAPLVCVTHQTSTRHRTHQRGRRRAHPPPEPPTWPPSCPPATRPTDVVPVVPTHHLTHRRCLRRAHPPPDPPT